MTEGFSVVMLSFVCCIVRYIPLVIEQFVSISKKKNQLSIRYQGVYGIALDATHPVDHIISERRVALYLD